MLKIDLGLADNKTDPARLSLRDYCISQLHQLNLVLVLHLASLVFTIQPKHKVMKK